MRGGTDRAEEPGRKLATGCTLLGTRNTIPALEACIFPKEGGFVRVEGRDLV